MHYIHSWTLSMILGPSGRFWAVTNPRKRSSSRSCLKRKRERYKNLGYTSVSWGRLWRSGVMLELRCRLLVGNGAQFRLNLQHDRSPIDATSSVSLFTGMFGQIASGVEEQSRRTIRRTRLPRPFCTYQVSLSRQNVHSSNRKPESPFSAPSIVAKPVGDAR